MAETAEVLFAQYCTLHKKEDRFEFALAAPRLLWLGTVKALAAHHPALDDKNRAYARLVELDGLRKHLSTPTISYPIGPGPIEMLMAADSEPAAIIEQCRSPEFQALVAPPYLRHLAHHSAELARAGDWETGAWISRFATEAALAWEPDSAIEHDIGEVILAHLVAAIFTLKQRLDETIFTQALAAAVKLLQRAEDTNDRKLVGEICQYVGALFSDMWSVPGPPRDDKPVDFKEWLMRPRVRQGLFYGLGPPGTIPDMASCLMTATAWYRRAIPCRKGSARGLTYKAIIQTEHFRERELGQKIDDPDLQRMRTIAEELLIKHRDAPLQLETLASIASQRGWPLDAAIPALDSTDTAWLRAIEAAYQPDDDAEFPALPRHDGHAEAMRDLERVLRHQLPWALYLRNFDHANKVHSLGEPIAYHSDNSSHYIVPEITYSLVDHKIVQLFSEGVITVSDPHTNFWHRSTLIPMLSLRHEKWQEVVAGLMRRCARVVMLLDELTPGVETELNLLREVDAAERTLIVCGHAFRVGQLTLPEKVASDFPHVVDWIDFSYDEAHYDMRYKAHRIVQPYLQRYVRGNAGPVVRNWLQT